MTTIHTILKALAERARNLSVDTEYNDGYRKGYFHALDEVEVEIDKAVVSVHDPIAGAIGSVKYDKWRIISEAGFLVANVRVFDLLKHENEFTVEDFGQWIADAINEKIGGNKAFDSDWLSPNDEERAMQVSKLKSLFPSFPTGGVKWQYMNGLLEMAMKQMQKPEKWVPKMHDQVFVVANTDGVREVGSWYWKGSRNELLMLANGFIFRTWTEAKNLSDKLNNGEFGEDRVSIVDEAVEEWMKRYEKPYTP